MTSKLIQDGQEKTFALVFDAGEEVVAGLLQFAKRPQAVRCPSHRYRSLRARHIGILRRGNKGLQENSASGASRADVARGQTSPRTTRAIRSSMLTSSSASRTAPHTAVTCWRLTFDRPWKSWLSKRHSICAARCAANSALPYWICRVSESARRDDWWRPA